MTVKPEHLERVLFTEEQVAAVKNYFQAQGMFGMPVKGQCDYSAVLELDLNEIRPSVARLAACAPTCSWSRSGGAAAAYSPSACRKGR